MRVRMLALTVMGLGASAVPAEAQFYSYSRSSFYSSGITSTLAGNSREEGGRIVRGYYNRYGQVVVTATQKDDASVRAAPVDAAAAATTYDKGPSVQRRAKRTAATAQR